MEVAPGPLLAAMPLHAITATYGEAGLRQRLTVEMRSFLDDERSAVDHALTLASRLHADDRRQREPYVNHLLRVAIRILSHYGIHDADVVCAALLHDAVEDHADGLAADGSQQAALAALSAEFGPRVAGLVAAVTNPEFQPGRDRNEQYREHVAASLERCPWARVIKVSDFTDNGIGLIHYSGPNLSRLAARYAPLVPVLRDLIARPDTPLSEQVKARIQEQLDQAARRFAAIASPG